MVYSINEVSNINEMANIRGGEVGGSPSTRRVTYYLSTTLL